MPPLFLQTQTDLLPTVTTFRPAEKGSSPPDWCEAEDPQRPACDALEAARTCGLFSWPYRDFPKCAALE